MPTPEARAERRRLASRRRRDTYPDPLHVAIFLMPIVLVVLFELARRATLGMSPDVIIPLLSLLTTMVGLGSALIVLRGNTLHLKQQDVALALNGQKTAEVGGKIDDQNHLVVEIRQLTNDRLDQALNRIIDLETLVKSTHDASAPPMVPGVQATKAEMSDALAGIYDASAPTTGPKLPPAMPPHDDALAREAVMLDGTAQETP
jgi:hypothetical protein